MADDTKLDEGFEEVELDTQLDEGFDVGPSVLDRQVPVSEALLRGAQQGLTFSLADELSGAIGAGIEGANVPAQKEESKLDQLSRLYKEYRDVARKEFKRAEEQQPLASFTGSVAGGALLPMGALVSSAKPIQTGAKIGAVAGAGYGAGGAEEMKDIPSEALQGAALGGALGAAGPSLAAGAKKTGQAIKEIPFMQDLIDTYRYHKKGVNLRGGSLPKVIDEAQQLGLQMEKVVDDAYKAKLSQKAENIQKVDDKIVNIKDKLESFKEKIKDLPEDSEDEKLLKKKLEALINDKIEGVKTFKTITKEVPVRETERAVLEKAELEKAKDLIRAMSMTEEQLAKSQNPEVAKMLQEGASPEDVAKYLQGTIDTEIVPTEFGNLKAGVITRNLPGGKVAPISSMPVRVEGPQTKMVTERVPVKGEPQTEMKPSELDKFIREIAEYTPIAQEGVRAKDATKLALDAKKELEQSLSEVVPSYTADNRELSEVMSLYEALIGRKIQGFDTTAERENINKKLGDLVKNNTISPDAELKLKKFIKEGIQRSSSPTDVSEALSTYDYKKALELEGRAKDIGRRYELMSKMKREIDTINPSKAALGGGIQSIGIKGASHLGDIRRNLGEKSSDFISSSTPESIQRLAEKVLQKATPEAQELASILNKASVGDRAKRGLLFGIMQNPKYRQLINEVEEESNEPVE